MFHKRLLREYKDLNGKIVGIVMTQWVMLIANIGMISALALLLQQLMQDAVGHKEAGIYSAMLFVTIITRVGMTKLNTILSTKVTGTVKLRMRSQIFQKLIRLGMSDRKRMKSAEVVQFTTEGVEQLEIYFGKYVPQFFYSILAPITLFISVKAAFVLLICVPLIPISIIVVQKFAKKMLAKYWGTYTEMGDSFLECLHGLTTLKIYDADAYYAKKMDAEAECFRKITMKVLIMQLNSISIMDLVAYGGAGVGILIAITEMNVGNLTFAQGFFLVMIAAEYFLPMRLLGSFFHIAMNGNAAADRIFELLDTPEQNGMSVKNRNCESVNEIIVNKLRFSYEDGNTILDQVSFELTKGLTALVGKSGCGKSTIASLLKRTCRADAGDIMIEGIPIEEIERNVLHQQIVKIGHDAYLFAGTIRSNLLMGKENATDQEILEILDKVNMRSFIEENGGLDYVVQERGSNLSGGQKQRLSLARAMLADGSVYIFDEATSNVDVESEDKIMEVVRELAKTKIVLVISHRYANVVGAERIYVIDDGKIIRKEGEDL